MKVSSVIVLSFSFFILVACGPSKPVPSQLEAETGGLVISPSNNGYPTDNTSAAYPDTSSATDSGYLAPDSTNESVFSEAPDPARELGQPEAGLGTVGGVLVREITDQGFIPITPNALYLARLINNDQGEPALMRRGDDAPRAELLQTGIFIFRNIPPGNYGIIIDLGFSQFPLNDESGEQLVFTVESGLALDLGQILVELPG